MKKALLVVAIISVLVLLSGCDVYNTLYVKQPSLQGAESVDPNAIVSSNETQEQPEVAKEIEIMPEEESSHSEATVIMLEETQKVSLQPKAQDPDNDVLTYAYTNPLDENGQWQTTYGDAGEYTVTVTASDGTLTASKQALLIIQRKEESPTIDDANPKGTSIEAKETDAVSFEVLASDLNRDPLTYLWKLDGGDVSDSNSYTFQTTFDDSGSHTIKVSVSDGMSNAEKIWALSVANVNRVPIVGELDDVDSRETDTIVIEVEASDEDGDSLTYHISDERFAADENTFSWQTGYDDSGEYPITITVSDGTDETARDIILTVENVNRPPTILDIVQNES